MKQKLKDIMDSLQDSNFLTELDLTEAEMERLENININLDFKNKKKLV